MDERTFAIAMKIAEHIPQALVLLWGIYKLVPRVEKLELRIGAHEDAMPILKAAPERRKARR